MIDDLLTAITFIAVAGIVVSLMVDATVFMVWIIRPGIELYQRVVLGIDEIRFGPETLAGTVAKVEDHFVLNQESNSREGYLMLDGECWRARGVDPAVSILTGHTVDVVGRDGLVLLVSLSK